MKQDRLLRKRMLRVSRNAWYRALCETASIWSRPEKVHSFIKCSLSTYYVLATGAKAVNRENLYPGKTDMGGKRAWTIIK